VFENKTVTLRHGFLKQMIMKQVEERYISFEASKMAYRDIKNSVDTAKREGIAEGKEIGMKEGMEKGLAEGMEKGRAEGKHEANTETAQRLLAMGLSAEQVAKATQLPLEIIKNLNNT
jgi:predicted transposase/invertase (TIGR01784 family)